MIELVQLKRQVPQLYKRVSRNLKLELLKIKKMKKRQKLSSNLRKLGQKFLLKSNNKEETKSKQKNWQQLKKKIKKNNKRLLILLLIFHLTKQKEKLTLKRVSVVYYLQMKKLEKDLKLVLQILEVKILGRLKEGQCRKSKGLKRKEWLLLKA